MWGKIARIRSARSYTRHFANSGTSASVQVVGSVTWHLAKTTASILLALHLFTRGKLPWMTFWRKSNEMPQRRKPMRIGGRSHKGSVEDPRARLGFAAKQPARVSTSIVFRLKVVVSCTWKARAMKQTCLLNNLDECARGTLPKMVALIRSARLIILNGTRRWGSGLLLNDHHLDLFA